MCCGRLTVRVIVEPRLAIHGELIHCVCAVYVARPGVTDDERERLLAPHAPRAAVSCHSDNPGDGDGGVACYHLLGKKGGVGE